jgi:hypothetical protein
LRQGLFGTGKGNERTHEIIDVNFQKHLQDRKLDDKKGVKSKTKPVHGVQSHWLLNIDPRQIIILTLHDEIRLIKKFTDEVTT